MNLKKSRGFTIVELVVVMVIVGILATIAVIGYGNWRTSTIATQLKSDLTNAAAAMENARNFGNGYPSDINNPPIFKSSPGVEISGGSTDGGKSFSLWAGNNGKYYTITDKTSPMVTVNPSVNITFNATSSGRYGTIKTLTIDKTWVYRINVLGAGGGAADPYRGGYGSNVSANFILSAGTVLRILVGQKGTDSGYAGGGGASGVWIFGASTPLIIAGGGGGANSNVNPHIGGDATRINDGASSYGAGGAGGNGGGAGYIAVGGGAGWYSNGGGNSSYYPPDIPAIAIKNGGNGGAAYGSDYQGGFGGGGNGFGGGGGGGGYSGGGGGNYTVAGSYGGGGGSYVDAQGINSSLVLSNNTGHGLVIITSI